MIRSMTGFARTERQGPWGRLAWELRAVNHRYFDLQLKIPEDLRSLEVELRNRAAAGLARGKVEAGLRYQPAAGDGGALRVDVERLRAIKRALDTVAAELNAYQEPDPLRLLNWPGVVAEAPVDPAPVLRAAVEAFDEALQAFNDSRRREGERLNDFLLERLQAMRELVAQVRERAPRVRDAWLQRLRGRLDEMGVDVEPARLAQEAVIAAQKLDVEEEMSRLAAHVDEVGAALRRPEAVGRRLDFLMQELNREANTLSSKSPDEEMTRAAVDMKVLIEQMREQVQNIE